MVIRLRSRLAPALLVLTALSGLASAGVPEPVRREVAGTIEGLEREWFAVYESHDLAPLDRLIADDFVATLADGSMRGKREHIASYATDFETVASVTSSELRVRVLTRDVAVATGLYTAMLRGKPGSEAVTRYRYTDTWLRRDGAWQCVATHENRLE